MIASKPDTSVEDDDFLDHIRKSVTPLARDVLGLIHSDPASVLTNAGKLSRLKIAEKLDVATRTADEIIDELQEVARGSLSH